MYCDLIKFHVYNLNLISIFKKGIILSDYIFEEEFNKFISSSSKWHSVGSIIPIILFLSGSQYCSFHLFLLTLIHINFWLWNFWFFIVYYYHYSSLYNKINKFISLFQLSDIQFLMSFFYFFLIFSSFYNILV
jgi:hypothetical protein